MRLELDTEACFAWKQPSCKIRGAEARHPLYPQPAYIFIIALKTSWHVCIYPIINCLLLKYKIIDVPTASKSSAWCSMRDKYLLDEEVREDGIQRRREAETERQWMSGLRKPRRSVWLEQNTCLEKGANAYMQCLVPTIPLRELIRITSDWEPILVGGLYRTLHNELIYIKVPNFRSENIPGAQEMSTLLSWYLDVQVLKFGNSSLTLMTNRISWQVVINFRKIEIKILFPRNLYHVESS